MNRKQIIFSGLLLVMAFLGGWSCSTKKNALLNRSFHGLVTRDNFYFHAMLKMIEAEKSIGNAQKDRYDRILPVYMGGDETSRKAVAPLLDEAIKKTSNAISRHSMLIGGAERNNWMDDCFLLNGKAYFYKGEYLQALENFEYVATQFKGESSRVEALAWIVKCHLQDGKVDDAQSMFDYAMSDGKYNRRQKGQLAAAAAALYIKKKEYDKAILELIKAISMPGNSRLQRTRLMFILGQIYVQEGQCKKANQMFSDVIKRNPPYEMTFNAKLYRARCFDVYSGKSGELKRMLKKMLTDVKNKEYLDQIYYTLGRIAQQEKENDMAVVYFRKSVASSVNNSNQKGLSYLELAHVFYHKPYYPSAQMYYDSALTFLDKDHPEHRDIQDRKNALTKLVRYLKTIHLEDSLQKLAKMTPEQIEGIIEKAIADKIKADKKKKEVEEQKTQGNQSTSTSSGGNDAPGAWYFYNPTTLSYGFAQFAKRWGNRPLEDNWRRSNKQMSAGLSPTAPTAKADTGKATTEGDTTELVIKDYKDKAQYLKTVPLEPKQLERSNRRLMDALYGAMGIYKDPLYNYREAANSGEDLLKRFPETRYKLPTWYSLYLLFTKLGDKPKAQYYKDLIMKNFPDSEYAQIVNDPNYLKNKKDLTTRVNNFYEKTFDLYQAGQYKEVLTKIKRADSIFPANEQKPKFEYLKALCKARLLGVDTFERALDTIIKRFPKDPVKIQAEETLAFIKLMREKGIDFARAQQKSKFSNNQDTLHYFIIAVTDSSFDSKKLQGMIDAYNKKYYTNETFTIETAYIKASVPVIIVKSFTNSKDGADYSYRIQTDEEVFVEEFDNVNFNKLIITPNNLARLLEDHDLDRYIYFFRINYPNVIIF